MTTLKESLRKFALPVVLFLFLITHISIGVYTAREKPGFFLQYDGSDYAELAISAAKNKTLAVKELRWFEPPRSVVIPEAYRPLLLSAVGSLFIVFDGHELEQLAVFQAVLATLLALVIFLIGRNLGGKLCAWLSLGIYCIHPLFNLYSISFSTEILFSLLLCLFILIWLTRTERIEKYAFLGFCGGLAVLARPTALLILPLCIPIILFTGKDKKMRNAVAVIIFTVSFMIPVMTGGLRNYYHFGELKLTSFFGGYNLFIGNCAENLDAYKSSDAKDFIHNQDNAWARGDKMAREMPPEYSANPPLQEKYWKSEAFKEIRKMGLPNYIYIICAKAWHFMRPWPLYGAHASASFWLIALFETLLYAVGLYGVWRLRKRWTEMLPFAVVIFAGLGAHAFVHVIMRHRVPFVDTALIVLAGYGLYCIISSFKTTFFKTAVITHDNI